MGISDPTRRLELPGSSIGVDWCERAGLFILYVGGGLWRIQALGLFMPMRLTRDGDCDTGRFDLFDCAERPDCAERARSSAAPTVGILASATMLGMDLRSPVDDMSRPCYAFTGE